MRPLPASIVTVAIAVVGHEKLVFLQKIREDGMPFFFSKKSNCVMILRIILDFPASKME
jgi:hypothetical protein